MSLVEKVLAGDSAATIALYKQLAPKLRNYLRYHLPNTEDPEDFLQEIFLIILDNLPLLKNKEHLMSWVYRITKNTIADYYRRRKIKYFLFSQLPFLEIIDKEVHSPDFIFEKNEIRDKIENTLKMLSLKYKNILTLRYEEDMSIKEMAKKLHLSCKATESLLFRARMQFIHTYEGK